MADCQQNDTVIIVDDDSALREALSVLMETAGFAVCSHESGEALLESSPPEGPACLLLDLQMLGLNGIEVQQRLRAADWDVPIIFLTGHGEVSVAVQALKQGALDFIEKSNFDPGDLIRQVTEAIEMHRRLLLEKAETVHLEQCLRKLSRREMEVARMAAGGTTNKVIGLELGISERTVEIHRGRAMKKLGLRTAAELIRLESHFSNAQ